MNSRIDLMCVNKTALPLLLISASLTGLSPEARCQDSAAAIEIPDAQVSLIQNTFIAAPIAGLVAEVFVVEGDRVRPGGRLVELDAEQAETELEAARAAYEAARLQIDNNSEARYAERTLEVAQSELNVSNNANRQFEGSISSTEIAKLQLAVDQARLAMEQAAHGQLVARATAQEKMAANRLAESRLRQHRIESTVAGTCVEIAVEPGEWVDQGMPVVRVISLDPIRVECLIDGRSFGTRLVGRSVDFYPLGRVEDDPASPAKPLTGKVTFVSPELHPVTGEARLWATIDNPQEIARAGMRGRIVIRGR